jgi:hypothetical protein
MPVRRSSRASRERPGASAEKSIVTLSVALGQLHRCSRSPWSVGEALERRRRSRASSPLWSDRDRRRASRRSPLPALSSDRQRHNTLATPRATEGVSELRRGSRRSPLNGCRHRSQVLKTSWSLFVVGAADREGECGEGEVGAPPPKVRTPRSSDRICFWRRWPILPRESS